MFSAMACSNAPENAKEVEKTHTSSKSDSVSDIFETELKTIGAKDIQDLPGGKIGFYDHEDNRWALAFQHMKHKDMVYLSVNRYLNIDAAHSNAASVLVLTQIATLNHRLHGIKLQLNPDNGAITFSSTLDDTDGVNRETLHSKTENLLNAAKEHHAPLKRALEMGQF